ncbi:SDR family NAD(P)-dependent oxidoreductase [Kibdelosporangium aridum]|nr:SDR family NAD(P)-dependent oxidoreductase [Kibdelosporangium aridum]
MTGRVVLITGAGRGIGREEALFFAAEGAKVVVNDPGVEPDGTGGDTGVAAAVVDEIVARGGVAVANTDSVSDWDGARRMVQAAVDTFGDLHVVVNNATIKADRAMDVMTESQFDDVVAVKLKGTFAVSHWAARYWRTQYEAGAGAGRAADSRGSGDCSAAGQAADAPADLANARLDQANAGAGRANAGAGRGIGCEPVDRTAHAPAGRTMAPAEVAPGTARAIAPEDQGIARVDRAIVNTSSGSGLVNPLPGQTNYAAANAGVAAMTISSALELGRYGVRVNCISPSMARTRLTSAVPGATADPQAIAPVAAYLATEDCPLTGQVLAVSAASHAPSEAVSAAPRAPSELGNDRGGQSVPRLHGDSVPRLRGGAVTINNGWSPGARVYPAGSTWTVAELAAALGELPFTDPFEKLAAALASALGTAGRDEIQRMINAQLDEASPNDRRTS